jgi:hypothetical protein
MSYHRLARGYPPGETGLAMCAELLWHLRGWTSYIHVDMSVALAQNVPMTKILTITSFQPSERTLSSSPMRSIPTRRPSTDIIFVGLWGYGAPRPTILNLSFTINAKVVAPWKCMVKRMASEVFGSRVNESSPFILRFINRPPHQHYQPHLVSGNEIWNK